MTLASTKSSRPRVAGTSNIAQDQPAQHREPDLAMAHRTGEECRAAPGPGPAHSSLFRKTAGGFGGISFSGNGLPSWPQSPAQGLPPLQPPHGASEWLQDNEAPSLAGDHMPK